MYDPFDKIAVTTGASTYVIALHYDLDAAAPDYTDEGGLVFLGDARTLSAQFGDVSHEVVELLRRHTADNDSLYDHEYRSSAAIARYLQMTYGLAGVLHITRSGDRYHAEAPCTKRYRGIEGLAWAPADATTPEDYTRGTVATYDAWANGEVYGYIVAGPDGREVSSCWDFYADPNEAFTGDAPLGFAHMVSQARADIDNDAAARKEQVNTIGAGFTGLI